MTFDLLQQSMRVGEYCIIKDGPKSTYPLGPTAPDFPGDSITDKSTDICTFLHCKIRWIEALPPLPRCSGRDRRAEWVSPVLRGIADEVVVMTSTPSKPADAYLGLLFCMEDMAL